MTFRSKDLIFYSASALIISLSLFSFSCKNGTAPEDPILKFRIGSQITGWAEEPGTYSRFNSATLFDIINGGDLSYIEDSLLEDGIHYLMNDSTDVNEVKNVIIFVYDYGTEENATFIFNKLAEWRVPPSAKLVLPGYDSTDVLASDLSGGINTLAHFDRYYFELSYTGYSDNNEAVNDALDFLEYINSMLR